MIVGRVTGACVTGVRVMAGHLTGAVARIAGVAFAYWGKKEGRLALILWAALTLPGLAQDVQSDAASDMVPDARLVAAADRFALAYVVTGDPEVDAMSEAGMRGLSAQLTYRTTVEPGPPVAIDLDSDDISVLSLIYWPVTETQVPPSPAAYLALERWLRNGGMLLIDSRDGDVAGLGGPDASPALRALIAPLAVPPLAPVPSDHVLTRAFYLIDGFPGRYEGSPVWVEAVGGDGGVTDGVAGGAGGVAAGGGAGDAGTVSMGGARNDGVTPVVIGANAWADAWAIDGNGLPLAALGAGFEGERQREIAYRFGINLVMVALTGNYKSDQVHVETLLDRLGREGGDQP